MSRVVLKVATRTATVAISPREKCGNNADLQMVDM